MPLRATAALTPHRPARPEQCTVWIKDQVAGAGLQACKRTSMNTNCAGGGRFAAAHFGLQTLRRRCCRHLMPSCVLCAPRGSRAECNPDGTCKFCAAGKGLLLPVAAIWLDAGYPESQVRGGPGAAPGAAAGRRQAAGTASARCGAAAALLAVAHHVPRRQPHTAWGARLHATTVERGACPVPPSRPPAAVHGRCHGAGQRQPDDWQPRQRVGGGLRRGLARLWLRGVRQGLQPAHRRRQGAGAWQRAACAWPALRLQTAPRSACPAARQRALASAAAPAACGGPP